jgi:hypothetical protein
MPEALCTFTDRRCTERVADEVHDWVKAAFPRSGHCRASKLGATHEAVHPPSTPRFPSHEGRCVAQEGGSPLDGRREGHVTEDRAPL